MPVDVPGGITPRYAQQYRRCGKPGCPLCAAGGRGHGPYWYAYWREGGRPCSRYLGKQPPPGLDLPQTPPEEAPAPTVPPAQAAGPPAVPLRVRTLGGFAVWRGETPLALGGWDRQQSGALVKWLLGAPGQRLTRDVVVEHFWPEAKPERGRANLRVLVHRLRRVLEEGNAGAGYVRYDGEVLALRPGATAGPDWLDAARFARAAREALAGREADACRAALALYGGEYLPEDAYAEWALARREELLGLRLALLEHLAVLCAASGEVEEAERCLRSVLAVDPCREEAAMGLMRLLAGSGRPGQALRAYRRLADVLREELGLMPEEQTQALARALTARLPPGPDLPLPETVPTNLPAALSSFIGRRRELAALRALLRPEPGAGDEANEAAPCRLLTLSGPGGVGKTRLALRLAEELLDAPGTYPDGVWLVELASLAEPALVPKAVAQALGVQEEATRSLIETLASHLKAKRLLLVLDNCEHLLTGCAPLVASLLAACPRVQVLATSRAALGVGGERPWPVPALSLPEADGVGAAGRLLESEAARLFLDRARVQRPDLALTEESAGTVARICRQVDGIALALELAAARTGVLSLEQLAGRLQQSLGLLVGGPRTAPARQRTLRATLDWSYALLGEGERVLLRRLRVFAGGCTLEAAEAICAGDGIVVEEVLDLLSGPVRHSLLQVEDIAGVARYRLLETVRQYAAEHLVASGEQAALEQRHTAYYRGLAEEAEPALTGAGQAEWLGQLEREHDNLRVVLRRALEHGEQQVGLRVAGALWRFWYIRGHVSEGRSWLEELLGRGGGQAPPAARAKALTGAGGLALRQGDAAQARLHYEASLALCRELGDTRGTAYALINLGNAAQELEGDRARVRALFEESLDLCRELGDTRGISYALNNLGTMAQEYGDRARARVLFEESLVRCRELGDKQGSAYALNNLGNLALAQDDSAQARVLLEESLTLCRELGEQQGIAANLEGLARLAAASATAPADLERAVRLFGAAAALREAIGMPLPPNERVVYGRATTALRASVGETTWATLWAAGQALRPEQAIDLALGAPFAP